MLKFEEIKNIFAPLPFGVIPYDSIRGHLIERHDKSRLPDGAKTVIIVLFPYYLGEDFYRNSNVARYAVPKDYHMVTREYLERFSVKLKEIFKNDGFVFYADGSPIPEVAAAVAAGLGIRGKNNLLINKEYGSWATIGEIVTTASFEGFESRGPHENICKNCDICQKACPTGALADGFTKEKCVSHKLQQKTPVSEADAALLKGIGSVYGCDICQKACPVNKNVKTTPIREYYDTARPVYRAGDYISDRAYSWRGEAVIRRNLNLMQN